MSVIRRTNQPVTFSAFDFPLFFSAVLWQSLPSTGKHWKGETFVGHWFKNNLWCVVRLVVWCVGTLHRIKKREKHQWKSVSFSGVAGLQSSTPPRVCFTIFRLSKWYQIAQSFLYSNIGSLWTFSLN